MQHLIEAILQFLFSAPKGSVRQKHIKATFLAVSIGLLAAVVFGVGLYYLNQAHRIGNR